MPSKRRRRVQLPKALLKQFQEWGRQGGKKRRAKLSAERRKEIARKARAAREAKRKKLT